MPEGIADFSVARFAAAMIDQRQNKTPAADAAGVLIVIWRQMFYSSVTVV